MPKQTIEIDVPDGYELIKPATYIKDCYGSDAIIIIAELKKKEPKFIEVRSFLWKDQDGNIHPKILTKMEHDAIGYLEKIELFIKWIDDDWRKVYV